MDLPRRQAAPTCVCNFVSLGVTVSWDFTYIPFMWAPISGNNPFLAYGVINDGRTPGERSRDGSYVPARE